MLVQVWQELDLIVKKNKTNKQTKKEKLINQLIIIHHRAVCVSVCVTDSKKNNLKHFYNQS